MFRWTRLRWFFFLSLILVPFPAGGKLPAAGAAPTGFHKEVRVAAPTRLDWQFAAAVFGPKSARLPDDYDSRKQRYQLYVPKTYKPGKAWPLVVFISPGDGPQGWQFWEKTCRQLGMLFCAPYGAGNNCPVGKRTRIVLDMLDDVRRHYRIDPDQTYLAGFSGGGRMACSIAFSLPEYFGGVIPVCGTNPLHRLAYVRHRVLDRLSVAFVTGEKDFNRKENEAYMYPYFQELKIRSRLWLVPKMGHGIPGTAVLDKVHSWLAEDLKRRREDVKVRPALAVAPDQAPSGEQQAARLLEAARAELKSAEHTWRGVALLQGIKARWDKTEAAGKAGKLLDGLLADPKKEKLIADQGGDEEQRSLTAQARALERFGQKGRALAAWRMLARLHPDTPAGKNAAQEVKRLQAKSTGPGKPFLGLGFTEQTATIDSVAAGGPAAAAGLKAGDVVVKLGATKVAGVQDIARALKAYKPGDKVKLQVRRKGKLVDVTLEIGRRPEADE